MEITGFTHELLTQETALRMHDLQFEKRIEELKEELAEQDREIARLKALILQLQCGSARSE